MQCVEKFRLSNVKARGAYSYRFALGVTGPSHHISECREIKFCSFYRIPHSHSGGYGVLYLLGYNKV
jgi:hypothetical protein